MPVTHLPKVRAIGTDTGTSTNPNWAGYDAIAGPFVAASGDWNTQCLNYSKTGSGYREASWVGIGGIHGNLIQAGTILTSGLVYHPFYEFVYDPNNGAYIDYADTVPCGTPIYAEAYYSTYLHLWCTDMQWSQSGYGQCYSPLSTYTPDQSTAEWVDERPFCGLKLAYLADFVVTNWTNAYATSTTHGGHTLAGSNPNSLTMVNEYNQSDILAQPNLTLSSATAFNDTWYDYGTDGANCALF